MSARLGLYAGVPWRFAIIFLIWTIFVTHGTFELRKPELRSDAYDSLARNLLHGRVDVDPETINWEGYRAPDGRMVMYWGPLPAMVRWMHFYAADWYGMHARVSCLLAATIALLGALVAVRNVPLRSVSRQRRAIHLTLWGVGLGTPMLFLLTSARIYHEAILWGFAPATWAIAAVTALTFGGARARWIGILSIAAALSLLGRVSFGLPLYLCLAFAVVQALGARNVNRRRLAFAIVPAVLGLLVQGWYNHERFGSVLRVKGSEQEEPRVAGRGGIFNVGRLHSNVRNYLVPRWAHFDSEPPFVRQLTSEYDKPALFEEWREWTLPLPLATPWLLAAVPVGLWQLGRSRRWAGIGFLCLLASEWLVILGYHFATQRYALEFVPLLLFLWCASLPVWSGLWCAGVMSVLIGAAAFANAASSVDWAARDTSYVDIPVKEMRFFTQFLSPRKPPAIIGSHTFLSDLKPLSTEWGFAAPLFDRTNSGAPLVAAAFEYKKGIGMHAPTSMTYKVPADARYFFAIVAREEGAFCFPQSVQFRLLGDADKVLWESGFHGVVGALARGTPLPRTTVPETALVSVAGQSTVTLVLDPLDNRDCDRGNWVNAAFVR